MRKQLPLLIATTFGFLMLVRFFSPAREMERLETVLLLYARIIGGFAMVLGIASLVRVNWIRIRRRQENWSYGVVTIAGFTLMFLVGGFGGLFIEKPTTLKLAFADGVKGACAASDDRASVTLVRPVGKRVLKRAGEPAPAGEQPYPGEWRFAAEPPPAGAESGSTESAAAAAPAPTAEAAPSPVVLTIAADGSGTLREGAPGDEKETRFTSTREGGGPFFSAGLSRDRNKVFDWVFQWVYTPMDATIFALLAFYIASAAFRSMRARDVTSALLLIAAVLVMLGRAPLTAYLWELLVHPPEGSYLWSLWVLPFETFKEAHPYLLKHHIPSLGQVTEWLMSYPNTAAKRAVIFGAGLAALAQSLRILVGIERPYMAGTGD